LPFAGLFKDFPLPSTYYMVARLAPQIFKRRQNTGFAAIMAIKNSKTAKGVKKAALSRPAQAEAEEAVRTLLRWIGEDPEREGLLDTPERVAKAYRELFGGYGRDPAEVLGTAFEETGGYNAPVLVKNIPFYSHCEHHMVPIIGKASIAYLPAGAVIGLSKLARLVEIYARRLQTQETMTAQIAGALEHNLKPRGVAVLLEAEHLCMAMRGVQKQGSRTITTSFCGAYAVDAALKAEFLRLLGT